MPLPCCPCPRATASSLKRPEDFTVIGTSGQAAGRTGEGRRSRRVRHRHQASGNEGRSGCHFARAWRKAAIGERGGRPHGQGRATGCHDRRGRRHRRGSYVGRKERAQGRGDRMAGRPECQRRQRDDRPPTRGGVANSRASWRGPKGDAEKALAGAAQRIDAVYQLPFLAHAAMEPMNCTVDYRHGCLRHLGRYAGADADAGDGCGDDRAAQSARSAFTTTFSAVASGGGSKPTAHCSR